VSVTVAVAGPGRPVPASFLGLSVETWEIPRLDRYRVQFARILRLLHVGGDAPLLLRIGGNSADVSWWTTRRSSAPSWAYPLTPAWVRHAADLIRYTHVRVILDLNLVDLDPGKAAAFARAFLAAVPRGSVAAFEVGNEPNLYSAQARAPRPLHLWRRPGLHAYFARLQGFTPRTYADLFAAYARALRRVAPGTPLAGPALGSNSPPAWTGDLIAAPALRTRLALVTTHRYPLSGCVTNPSAPGYPSVGHLLADRSFARTTDNVRGIVAQARAAGLGVRLTELNSVTCGGARQLSDTFATALWAPDALFSLMRAGVAGVNIHVRMAALNAPFAVGRAGLTTHPVLYGLALFTRAIGHAGSRLLDTVVHAPAGVEIRAYAVRGWRHGMRVLLVNTGRTAAAVSLRLGTCRRTGGVQRLTAPSVTAGRASLAGRRLGGSGRWSGPRITAAATCRRGRYTVVAAPYSAALLSVPA
jgi:hypothetical protein